MAPFTIAYGFLDLSHDRTVLEDSAVDLAPGWLRLHLRYRRAGGGDMGIGWAAVRIFRYVATDHKYRYDDRHIPDGLPDPAYAKQGYPGDPYQTRRTDPRNEPSPKYPDQSGG